MEDWLTGPLEFLQVIAVIVRTIVSSLGDFGLMFSMVITVFCTLRIVHQVGYKE